MNAKQTAVIEFAIVSVGHEEKFNRQEAAKRVELTIDRAERLIADLKNRLQVINDEAAPYDLTDLLNWSLNDAQNFVRNLDPDQWARTAARVSATNAKKRLLVDIVAAV